MASTERRRIGKPCRRSAAEFGSVYVKMHLLCIQRARPAGSWKLKQAGREADQCPTFRVRKAQGGLRGRKLKQPRNLLGASMD